MEEILARYRITENHTDEYYNEEITGVNRLFGLRDLCKFYSVGKNWRVLEIGSYAGASAELMAQYAGLVICCDVWEAFIKPESRAQVVYSDFLKTKKRNPNILERKIDSNILAKEYGFNTLDMVYIDADHTYEPVKMDILTWKDKVRPGGIISGHDYMEGVKQAVDEIFGAENIKVFSDSSWAIKKAL